MFLTKIYFAFDNLRVSQLPRTKPAKISLDNHMGYRLSMMYNHCKHDVMLTIDFNGASQQQTFFYPWVTLGIQASQSTM